MNDLFHNKYRIESTRLKDYDYSLPGVYFITICTKNKGNYFGEIKNNKIYYSKMGEIAQKYWHQITQHFPFVELDEFIVMPNHIHGIIVVNKNNTLGSYKRMVETHNYVPKNNNDIVETHNYVPKNMNGLVETHNYASLRNAQPLYQGNVFGPQSKNLASIIRSYNME